MLPGPCTCTGTCRSLEVPSPSLPQVPLPRVQLLNPHVQTVPSDLRAIDSLAPPQTEMTVAGDDGRANAATSAQPASLSEGVWHRLVLILGTWAVAGRVEAARRSRGIEINHQRARMRPSSAAPCSDANAKNS